MFCTNCGNKLAEGLICCNECGKEVSVNMQVKEAVLPKNFQYAGFWKRFEAVLVDGLVLFGFSLLLLPFIAISENCILVIGPLLIIASFLYGPLMESSDRQATLGKMALGIIVTDVEGKRISFGRAIARNISKIVSSSIYNIGYIIAAFTGRKQALHDLIASTLVIVKDK